MKKNPFKLLGIVLLGGLLALPAVIDSKPAIGVKAEDEQTKLVSFTSSKVKSAISNSYSNAKFTIDGVSFESKNICYQGSSGSEYLQIKGNTNNGFWSTTTFENYYISAVTMTVTSNAGKIGYGSTSSISALSNLATGSYSSTFDEDDNYSFIKIMSAGNTVQIKNLKITYSLKTGDVDPTSFEGDYSLVKDSSSLKTGDEIVLGVSSKGVAAGSLSSKSLQGTAATIKNESLSSADANVLTLSKTDNGFKLLSNDGYIGTTVVKELALDVETEWTISIDSSSYKATIKAGDYGQIMYNCNNTSIFRNYTSAESDSMILPEIYLNTKSTALTYSITYDGNGHTGTVVDSNSPYVKASEVEVLANTFDAKTGEVFKEWNTKADGSGTSYQPNDKFTITGDTTLYAIWEEEYVPVGDTFTKITSASALGSGDKFLFVYKSGETVKVNGSLEGSDHFTAYDAKIIDDELSYNNEKVTPLTLVKDGSSYYIELNGSYLTLTANSSNKLAWKEKAKANKWTISFSGGNAVVSSTISEVTHSIFYNGSGTGRFSNYSSSTMSPIELWAKSGHAKEVHLDVESLNINAGQTGKVKISECVGFEPSSFAWEITEGSEFVSITSGQGTNEVTLTGISEGEAELYVTVDGVKAKATIYVHEYKYDVLSGDSYFIAADGAMMASDLSYVIDPEFEDSNLWSFEKAYEGDNSYYLSSSAGYLSFSEDVNPDGKNVSQLEITKNRINVWTVSYSDGNGFKVETVTKTQGKRLLATHEETWYAFTGNNYVKLLEAGTFDHIEIKSLPTTKQYFVGDELKPLNSHIYAVYSNGYEVEITSKITWDKLTAGTKAYGKVTLGGVERQIEMDGLQIYKGDAETFAVEGLNDTYAVGEKINKDLLTVSITYKLSGAKDITKTLAKNDFVVTPERIEENTTTVSIALAKDSTVVYNKTIEIKESPYVATPHVYDGDTIIIGTLGYNPYEITGGVELCYKDSKFTYSNFGSLPRGYFPLEVGKVGNYYTLQDPETGFYLKGDNSTLGFNMPDMKSVYSEADGHYEFNLNVSIGGATHLVTMKTDLDPNFESTSVFSSMDYVDGYTDYIVGASDLENNLLTFQMWSIKNEYAEVYDTATVQLSTWKYHGGVFQYALETSSVLPDECYFTLNYDALFEEWSVSSKPHQDKQLYFNKDGKFGFYEIGSSYTPVMLFRDNDKPLQTEIKSLSVSFQEGMNEVSVGEQFPWTSALIVKANYEGGASKVIPVGGYVLKQMPDTSKIGPAKGIVCYGQNGHQIQKEFTINVKGHTTAFDVVCKDPVLVGEEYQAHLADHYAPPEGEPITWSTSDPSIATIDQDGWITGLKDGYVDIIATSFDGTYSDFEHIHIYQQVESVELNIHEATIKASETVQLSATVLPEGASNKRVTYSSSDDTVAHVDENTGLVTGVKAGKVTITCAAQNKPEKNFDTCEITVEPGEITIVPVTGVELNTKELVLDLVNVKTANLVATITPENATIKTVTWSSNHENIAKVDQNGQVKAVAKGECEITVKTSDGGFTAKCKVTVKKSGAEVIHVENVSLNATNKTLALNEEFTLVPTIAPSNATNHNVSWKTSNEQVATVNKGVVTAVGEGTTTITCTSSDNPSAVATCTITVKGDETIHVENVTLDKENLILGLNGKATLNVTVNPSDASNKEVNWSSSNTQVATVENGVVTAVGEGTAIIKVTSADGGKEATCKVDVTSSKIDVTSVTLNKTELELEIGSEETLIATVEPDSATVKNITWSSSSPTIVSVDLSGKISALAEGSAIITVTSEDGEKQATCFVTVVKTADPDKPDDAADIEEMKQQIIVIGSIAGGTVAVGAGCGITIPLVIRRKHRKIIK